MEKRWKAPLAIGFTVATGLIFGGCTTSTEQPITPENLNRSPVVVCPNGSEQYPHGIMLVFFAKEGGSTVGIHGQARTGSDFFQVDQDGNLIPFTDSDTKFVRTDLPIQFELEGQVFNLDGCLVDPNDKPNLQRFFQTITPAPDASGGIQAVLPQRMSTHLNPTRGLVGDALRQSHVSKPALPANQPIRGRIRFT